MRGSYTSPALNAPFAAKEAILSINLRNAEPDSTAVAGCLSCSADGGHWSNWYRMFVWGKAKNTDAQREGAEGHVKIDVLALSHSTCHWRYRISWSNERRKAIVRRVALNLFDPKPTSSKSAEPNRAAWGTRLAVPFLSQWDVKQHQSNRVCSPTALAMVARFHGKGLSADEMSSAAYDGVHNGYGNWALNMLAASRYGFRSYVDRATDIRFLEDRVASRLPTIVSIAYAEGQLSGAPMPKTEGHLVVVAGFDGQGNPIVRDPAARGDDTWVTYDRSQFARAWLEHGGVAYVVEPEA